MKREKKQHYKKVRFLVFFFVFISLSYAEFDSTSSTFFNGLNLSLHSEYVSCTSDSTPLTLDSLLKWKNKIDSITKCAGYPALLRKYSEETGIPPSLAKPCEVVNWMNNLKENLDKSTKMLAYEKEIFRKKREDSLFLVSELKNVKRFPYDLLSIPFGISKRAFLLMTKRKKLPVVDSGSFCYSDSVPIGIMSFKSYFYFSKKDRYISYVLESSDCSSDSLDIWARGMMDYMSALIETKINKPPDHIYRIGRFDIVAGRIAICKVWNLSDATISAGLSRRKNRFYAKMVVSWKNN